MTKLDFSIKSLGEAKIPSPLRMIDLNGDGFADYVSDNDKILYSIDTIVKEKGHIVPKSEETVELAGTITVGDTESDFWGVYPYSSENSCDGSSITTVIPARQAGVARNFSGNVFPAMAKASSVVTSPFLK